MLITTNRNMNKYIKLVNKFKLWVVLFFIWKIKNVFKINKIKLSLFLHMGFMEVLLTKTLV